MENTVVMMAEPAVEETPEVTPVKKQRKPRTTKPKTTKPRDLEELKYAEIKTMTDKEKEILIHAQADELGALRAQNEALRNNCEMAYEKCRLYEDDFKKMDTFYRDKLNFVTEQMNAFHRTIRLATTGGMN